MADDGGEADERGRLVALLADLVEELDGGHGQGDGDDQADDVALAEVQQQRGTTAARPKPTAMAMGRSRPAAPPAPDAPSSVPGRARRRVGRLPPGADRRDPRLLAGRRGVVRLVVGRSTGRETSPVPNRSPPASGSTGGRSSVSGVEVEVGVGVLALVVAPDRGLAGEARPRRRRRRAALVGQDLRHLAGGRLRPVRQGAGVVRAEAQRRPGRRASVVRRVVDSGRRSVGRRRSSSRASPSSLVCS